MIGAPMVNALSETNNDIDTLLGLRHAAADALAGHPPSSGQDLVKLADQYKKAAADIRASPMPTTLIPTTNSVSLTELTNCSTRPGAIVKFNNFLADMRATQQKGQASLAQLDGEQTQIAKAGEALTFLTNSFRQLSQVPVFGDQFALHWLDIQGIVSQSLSDLRSAVKDQRKVFASNLALLQTEIANFQSNLTLVNSLPHCSPVAGNWGRDRFVRLHALWRRWGVLYLERSYGQRARQSFDQSSWQRREWKHQFEHARNGLPALCPISPWQRSTFIQSGSRLDERQLYPG